MWIGHRKKRAHEYALPAYEKLLLRNYIAAHRQVFLCRDKLGLHSVYHVYQGVMRWKGSYEDRLEAERVFVSLGED